jgi:DsbC/DsbD-like thiol-disulfide interchange protein
MTTVLALLLLSGDWSAPVQIEHNDRLAMEFRARFDGAHLIVEIRPEPGWHTYAMDNKQRQDAALKGRRSLGSEKPTTVEAGEGLTVTGPWRQSPPEDFSKPEIQFYSYGFAKPSLLAAPAQASAKSAEVIVKGQACTDSVCLPVTAHLKVDLTPGAPTDLAGLTGLVR